jgi:hypothetical protein
MVPANSLSLHDHRTIQNIAQLKKKICEVMEKIRLKKEEDWNMNRLEHEIALAPHQIERFDETFTHCGYQWK